MIEADVVSTAEDGTDVVRISELLLTTTEEDGTETLLELLKNP